MTRTANDILKARVGDLMFEVATIQAEAEALKEKLVEVARMLPPEELAKLKLKIGNGEAAPAPPGDPGAPIPSLVPGASDALRAPPEET